MKDSAAACDSCPAPVDISSWADNEGPEQVGAHVRVCPVCERTVLFYRRVDSTVQSATAPAPGLAERIEAHCRNLPEERPAFRLHPGLLRAAAVFAMVVTVAALVSVSVRRPETESLARGPDVSSPGAADGPFTAYSGTRAEPVRSVSVRDVQQPGNVKRTSAYGGSPNARFVYQPASVAPLRKRAIPRRVSHVWVVPDLERCRAEFLRQLPSAARAVPVDAGEGVLGFRVLLRDDRLKGLVDHLAELDYSLVSSGLPQPHDNVSVPSQQNVVYGVQFVAARQHAAE